MIVLANWLKAQRQKEAKNMLVGSTQISLLSVENISYGHQGK